MKIGIDLDVFDKLASTTENTEHYLSQLKCEGHDVKIITDPKKREGLDLHIDNKFGSWWEIYNYIRYGS